MNTDIRPTQENAFRASAKIADEHRSRGILAWIARRPQLALGLLTVACLLPFSGKPFHIDDPLFVWTAQHITRAPFNFYGYSATWWARTTPMWQIQQNPPLAAYYIALIGSIAGWSERALHIGLLLPAVVVVLSTYHLALRFTSRPAIAAAITLVAPGFLVSATGVMCDVSMLALWLLAILLWVKGLDDGLKPVYLTIAACLMGAAPLTKYFGVSLIPLLFVYTLVRQRSVRGWIGYFAIPLVMLGAYQFYTYKVYGYGLLSLAAGGPSVSGSGATKMTVAPVSYFRTNDAARRLLVGLAFIGGCMLPALTFVPVLWSRRQIFRGAIASALLVWIFFRDWVHLDKVYNHEAWLHTHRGWISVHLFFCMAGGISVLALAIADLRKRRDAAALLLALWIFGTLLFAVVVNWDVNARSLLPMIPAVAILMARRIEEKQPAPPVDPQGRSWTGQWQVATAAGLIVSAAVSLWVAAGDMALANTARTAAHFIHDKTRDDRGVVWFEGRWGFEYYMQQLGARPVEPEADQCRFGDLIVIPRYNTTQVPFPLSTTRPEMVSFDVLTWVTPMNFDAGAGFYFSGWGPVPFVFGHVPTQQYLMARVLQNGNGQ